MKKNQTKKALGRGLEALIPTGIGDDILNDVDEKDNRVEELDIELIKPNAFQPRKHFKKEEIEELSASIKRYGVLQPLLVRKMGSSYEIIAGERRWRASKSCKLKTVPVIVLDLDEERRFEISLVENIQRTDLNPIEEAYAYKTLIDKYNLTQEEVATRIGKSRTYITNLIRLLSMSERIKDDIVEGRLSVGHAKVIAALSIEEQEAYAEMVKSENLNVRDLEARLKAKNEKKEPRVEASPAKPKDDVSFDYEEVVEELSEVLKTRVTVKEFHNKGAIHIEFYDLEDFNRIYEILKNR